MGEKDYYEVLGISRDATEKEITKAYRKMAMKHHPDRNPGDEQAEGKFKEATEAYEVLSNANKRNQYDTYGTVEDSPFDFDMHMDMGDAMGVFRRVFEDFGLGRGFGGFSGFDEDPFSSIFSRGSGGGRQRSRRGTDGSDIRSDISIDIREAAKSVSRTIEIEAMVKCPGCKGTRMGENGKMATCSRCDGMGQVKEVRRTMFGQIINITACSECSGEGKIIKGNCPECKGKGRVKKGRRISIEIPPGVTDGSSLRLKEKGNEGINGGRTGDLYVVVNIPEDPFFKRSGHDIAVEVPITIGQALLGDTIKIPTLAGEEKITIKPGTEPDTVITLKGKGMPRLGGRGRGDQYMRLFYILPTKLTAKKKKLAKLWFDLEKEERRAIDETLRKRAKGK